MQLDVLLEHLKDGDAPLCIVGDDNEREAAYRAIMRRLDAVNPLFVRSHSPRAILTRNGGSLLILTALELLAQIGPLQDIHIPAGKFWLGRDNGYSDERPMRQHDSAAFWMQPFPVTVGTYALAVRAGVVDAPPTGPMGVTWEDQQCHPFHPVVMVHQEDCEMFALWLARLTGQPWRLPTEAEWEYAARGSDQRLYPWGDADDLSRANVTNQDEDNEDDEDTDDEPFAATLESVGCRRAGDSPFGVADMVGNIAEWTSSPLTTYGEDTTPNNPSLTMVVRGGSYETDLRTLTFREYASRFERRLTLGFRLVRSW